MRLLFITPLISPARREFIELISMNTITHEEGNTRLQFLKVDSSEALAQKLMLECRGAVEFGKERRQLIVFRKFWMSLYERQV